MRKIFYFVLAGSCAAAAIAQTASKPASQAAKPATSTAKSSTANSAGATAKTASKIPVVHGVPRTAFSLRYIDYKIGTGKEAEPNKMYHVLYTGYLSSTGQVFDSSDEHRTPKMGKDNKPEMGPDGKPVLGDPQPLVFPQGFGRLIPGFDQGFAGMHVGGKRRILIPWQLAYGTHDMPARGDHPGIPAKSDLIFDVELVDVTDMPTPPQRPGMPPHPGAAPAPGAPAAPPAGAVPTAPAKPAAPSTAPAPTTPPAGSTTPQPQAK